MKTNGKVVRLPHPSRFSKGGNSNSLQATHEPAPSEPDTANLARLIAAYAPHDGSFELSVPGLHASRMARVNSECFHTLRLPSLCIAAQGGSDACRRAQVQVRAVQQDVAG